MEILQLLEDWKEYSGIRNIQKPEDWENRLKEVNKLLRGSGMPSHLRAFRIQEAMGTSDFPLLFGDVIDRSMLGVYQTVPAEWKRYMKERKVKDFRVAYMFATYGQDQILEEVPEKGEYQASNKKEIKYEISVKKYGRQFDISWEALINDDLGALTDTPQQFAYAASNSEHYRAVAQYCADIGTHTEGVGGNLYQQNINAFALPLTIGNLETMVATMRQFRSLSGMPILNRPKYLVVPPALEFTARQILTSANKMWLSQGGGDGTIINSPMPTANVMANYGLELIVDDFLPYCHTVLESGLEDEAWYLFAEPSQIAAVGYGRLTGHETPEVCMKSSNKVAIGGGDVGPLSGDFESDNVLYRVRDVFGTCKLDWRATCMSVGESGYFED